MGKGSRQRPTRRDLFDENYDRIFRQNKKVKVTWESCFICDEVTQHRDGECFKCHLESQT